MPAARKKRNFWGTTQYSARLGGTYTTEKERKRRITEQRREAILDKKLRAQEIAAEAKVRAAEKKIAKVEKVADRKIAAVEQKIDTAEKKVSKGALTESGFAAIKERMEREIEAQERHKAAAIAKYGNPIGNPAFGYGVYKPGFMGEQQVEHFSSRAAAETWARSSGLTGYKIKRAFKKNGGSGHRPGARSSSTGNSEQQQGNPAVSREQYRLAQAVLSGTAHEAMPRKIAQEIVDRTPARLRSAFMMGTAGGSGSQPGARSSSTGNTEQNPYACTPAEKRRLEKLIRSGKAHLNPEAQDDGSEEYKQASRTAELFHGRPVKEEISVTESIKEHDWYVSIGPLIKLKIRTLTKRNATLPFARSGEGKVELFCSPDGRQFYLRGGDQELDLKPLGMGEGTQWFRDHMVIGECKEITYQDQKKFHKFAPVDYFHKLGEVTKKKPALLYDTLAGKLSIVGGQYKVEMEDLVEGMSPGIVN